MSISGEAGRVLSELRLELLRHDAGEAPAPHPYRVRVRVRVSVGVSVRG